MFPTPVRILVFAPSRSGRNDRHRNPPALGKDLRGEDLETCSGKGVLRIFSSLSLASPVSVGPVELVKLDM